MYKQYSKYTVHSLGSGCEGIFIYFLVLHTTNPLTTNDQYDRAVSDVEKEPQLLLYYWRDSLDEFTAWHVHISPA